MLQIKITPFEAVLGRHGATSTYKVNNLHRLGRFRDTATFVFRVAKTLGKQMRYRLVSD